MNDSRPFRVGNCSQSLPTSTIPKAEEHNISLIYTPIYSIQAIDPDIDFSFKPLLWTSKHVQAQPWHLTCRLTSLDRPVASLRSEARQPNRLLTAGHPMTARQEAALGLSQLHSSWRGPHGHRTEDVAAVQEFGALTKTSRKNLDNDASCLAVCFKPEAAGGRRLDLCHECASITLYIPGSKRSCRKRMFKKGVYMSPLFDRCFTN